MVAVLMDDTITLDRKSFEALAADSRVRILKSLSRRRKTLTELAEEIRLSASTMKEHLDVLSSAGIVVQMDEGRKWKYYELTRKGKEIVSPAHREIKVLIMLGLSILLVLGSSWNFFSAFSTYSAPPGSVAAQEAQGANALPLTASAAALPQENAGAETAEGAPPPQAKMIADAGSSGDLSVTEESGLASTEQQVDQATEFPLLEAVLMGLSFCIFLLSIYYARKG